MNIDIKILNKILANQIQHCIKCTYNQEGFISVIQDWFNIKKSMNIIHKLKNKNHMIIPIDAEKEMDRSVHS